MKTLSEDMVRWHRGDLRRIVEYLKYHPGDWTSWIAREVMHNDKTKTRQPFDGSAELNTPEEALSKISGQDTQEKPDFFKLAVNMSGIPTSKKESPNS